MKFLKYVNELSNTIDLSSTLVRAEALFYKFQRTIEAADRKHGFPAPGTLTPMVRLPHKRTTSSLSVKSDTNTSNGNSVGKKKDTTGIPDITSELRGLLSREVIKVDKEKKAEVAAKAKSSVFS